MKSFLERIRRRLPAGPATRRPGMSRYLVASVSIHAAAMLALSITVTRPPRPIYADPIYDVALVEWPEPNYEPPKPTRTVERPRPRDPEPEPEVKPPEPLDEVKIPEKPTPKPEEKPPEPEPEPEAKPPEKPPEETVEETAPEAKVDIPAAPVEPVSVGMVDQRDFRHDYYLELIRARLAQTWRPPRGADGLMRSMVHFVILRDGSVVQPFLREPSGISHYDRSALRAVQEVGKFPPLPEAYSGDHLGISVVFQTMGEDP